MKESEQIEQIIKSGLIRRVAFAKPDELRIDYMGWGIYTIRYYGIEFATILVGDNKARPYDDMVTREQERQVKSSAEAIDVARFILGAK